MENKMKTFTKFAAVCVLTLAAGTLPAMADACSGRSHDTGTALGAVGGGVIGGVATHSVAGGLVGAVAGGLAGNAISRSQDCNRSSRYERRTSYYTDRHGRRHYRYR
jgi:uncharacterized protein YcfJ